MPYAKGVGRQQAEQLGMETFVIEGGHPVSGTVTPGGNKNAALPLLAACLLTDEPIILRNLPAIGDVTTMGQLLADVGVSIEKLDPHTWRVHASDVRASALDPRLFGIIRGSITLAGPMLARMGQVDRPRPGDSTRLRGSRNRSLPPQREQQNR